MLRGWERWKRAGVAEGEIVQQELMAGRCAVMKQEVPREFRRAWTIRVAEVAEDAEEIIFDERTGRPSFALGRGKKPLGTGVMRMLAIEQGNQDIGIQ